MFESIEAVRAQYRGFFTAFELVSVVVFTTEYVLRIWLCTDDPRNRYRGSFRGRLRYALTPMAIIDSLPLRRSTCRCCSPSISVSCGSSGCCGCSS